MKMTADGILLLIATLVRSILKPHWIYFTSEPRTMRERTYFALFWLLRRWLLFFDALPDHVGNSFHGTKQDIPWLVGATRSSPRDGGMVQRHHRTPVICWRSREGWCPFPYHSRSGHLPHHRAGGHHWWVPTVASYYSLGSGFTILSRWRAGRIFLRIYEGGYTTTTTRNW